MNPLDPSGPARHRVPVAPSDPTIPGSQASGSAVRAELDQGTVLWLDHGYVLGRDPTPPPSHPRATAFAVVDRDRSITKTHLYLGPAEGGAEVVDLHSTNGVVVSEPGRPRRRLDPAVPATVPVGTLIEYGRRTIVVRP